MYLKGRLTRVSNGGVVNLDDGVGAAWIHIREFLGQCDVRGLVTGQGHSSAPIHQPS